MKKVLIRTPISDFPKPKALKSRGATTYFTYQYYKQKRKSLLSRRSLPQEQLLNQDSKQQNKSQRAQEFKQNNLQFYKKPETHQEAPETYKEIPETPPSPPQQAPQIITPERQLHQPSNDGKQYDVETNDELNQGMRFIPPGQLKKFQNLTSLNPDKA